MTPIGWINREGPSGKGAVRLMGSQIADISSYLWRSCQVSPAGQDRTELRESDIGTSVVSYASSFSGTSSGCVRLPCAFNMGILTPLSWAIVIASS